MGCKRGKVPVKQKLNTKNELRFRAPKQAPKTARGLVLGV